MGKKLAMGLLILTIAASILLAIAAVGLVVTGGMEDVMRRMGMPTPPESFPPPGDPRAFDGFEMLPEVSDFAGMNCEVVEIDLMRVSSEGLMDLEADYKPQANYEFLCDVILTEQERNAPIGAGGLEVNEGDRRALSVSIFQPGQRRHFSSRGSGTNVEMDYIHKGMVIHRAHLVRAANAQSIPAPSCSTSQLWEAAIEAGAPGNAVARIRYEDNAYRFSIDGTDVDLKFDANCELIKR